MELLAGELGAAFQAVNMVKAKNSIPSSLTIKMVLKEDTLKLYLTGDAVAVGRCKVENPDGESFRWYVDRKSLETFLKGLTADDKLSCSVMKDSKLQFRCGRKNIRIPNMDKIAGYGFFRDQQEDEFSLAGDTETDMRLVTEYACQDPRNPNLSCIYFQDGVALSTDKLNVCMIRVPGKVEGPYPTEFLQWLDLEDTKHYVSDAGFRVVFSGGYVFQPHNKEAQRRFPVAKIMAAFDAALKWDHNLTLPSEQFLLALKSLRQYGAGAGEISVRLKKKSGTDMARLTNCRTQVEAEEEIKLHGVDDARISVEWLPASLMPFFEFSVYSEIPEVEVRWGPNTSYYFKAGDRFHLLSPRYVGDKEEEEEILPPPPKKKAKKRVNFGGAAKKRLDRVSKG